MLSPPLHSKGRLKSYKITWVEGNILKLNIMFFWNNFVPKSTIKSWYLSISQNRTNKPPFYRHTILLFFDTEILSSKICHYTHFDFDFRSTYHQFIVDTMLFWYFLFVLKSTIKLWYFPTFQNRTKEPSFYRTYHK